MRYYRNIVPAVFFITQTFAVAVPAFADMVYLKNGRKMECLVRTQGRDTVELEVEIGTIRLRVSEILKIDKYDSAANRQMVEGWKARKAKAEADRQAWLKEENERAEKEKARKDYEPKGVKVKLASGHMVVPVRINNSVTAELLVDTGASVIVLSRSAGEKLGLVTAADTPDNKKMNRIQLQVADGRKLDAKYVMLDKVSVNGSDADQVEAAVFLSSQADMSYDGVLGMSYLKRFNVGFNAKENRLTLERLK